MQFEEKSTTLSIFPSFKLDLTFLKSSFMHTFFLDILNFFRYYILDIELVRDGRVGDVFVLSWLSSALLV